LAKLESVPKAMSRSLLSESIEVGTPVAWRPPHKSRRAVFPLRALHIHSLSTRPLVELSIQIYGSSLSERPCQLAIQLSLSPFLRDPGSRHLKSVQGGVDSSPRQAYFLTSTFEPLVEQPHRLVIIVP